MQKIKKLADFVLKYGILAWLAVALVWYLIVSTLHRVISCDEGYYLMGFLRDQNVEGQASNFHFITRALCRLFADDDIIVFRYVRLIVNVLALVVFTLSSFEWLSRKKGLQASRWLYYSMAALAGAMSFTFAAPTLSYDNIEVVITLLAASLLFVHLTTHRRGVKSVCAVGIGFFLWFAFTNYPPAGACLTVLFAVIFFIGEEGNKWRSVLFVMLGVVVALVFTHFFVQDIAKYFTEIKNVFVVTFTETSPSGHDSNSLVTAMLKTVGKQLLILVPVVIVAALFYWKVRLPEWLLWALTAAVCVCLLLFRKEYEWRGTLLLLPVALTLGKVLANSGGKPTDYLVSKDFWIAFALVAIPLAGVFGTNQGIMIKAVIYTSFWMLAYFLLTTRVKSGQDMRMHLVFIVMLLGGYVYLGNFQRYHCYYTPRSSRYEIVGANRPQRVLVSEYQQEYYKDVFDSLQVAGCKAGDNFMAFGENQMTVYLYGGYISGRLVYHDIQYKTFDAEQPVAFVLFRCEEPGVIERFGQAEWNFPEGYRRMEMRQMSQNMGDNYRTVIYVKKKSNNYDEKETEP